MVKIYWLSDSPTMVTGYATISSNILNGLSKLGYECYYQAHNYIGQTIPPGLTFEDGRKLNFTILGGGKEPYSKDMIMPRIRQLKPDIFGTLLDSLTEERIIPILNKRNKVELLSFKELYEKYRGIEGLKTLSVRLRKSKKGEELITEWKNIKGIERRFVTNHNIINISQKYGNTRTTEKHSLICKDNKKLIKVTPQQIFTEQRKLLRVSRIPFKERYYSKTKLDLTEYIDLNIFDYDDKFIWLKDFRRKQEEKIKRFLDKNEIKSLVKIFAWYISEGHCSKQNCIIISNTNVNELKSLSDDFIKIFKKQPRISNKKNIKDKTQCLNLWGKLECEFLKDLSGHLCRNKFIPNFIYELDEKLQLHFINEIVKGNGSIHKPYTKIENKFSNRGLRFSYTTLSLKLISGLSFLLKQLRINFSMEHNPENEDYNIHTSIKDINRRKTFLKEENYTGYIYDICVEDNENFVDCCGMIVCHNTFMLFPWYMQLDFAPAKSLFYYPSDGEGGMPLRCEGILQKSNIPVAMSKFAQNQVKTNYNINTHYIPHAVDTTNYYPLPQKQKEELKEKNGLGGKFVIGSVYRNQGRKMPDRMFKAFAIFAKTHPDAILFLHSDPYDGAAPFDSVELIKKLGIQNRVVWSGMNYYNGFDYKKMNEIYNIMDVFFLSTSGEGFGIPTVEASACGIPTAVTDYTTTQELLVNYKQCGIPIPISADLTGSWNVERGIMDINKAVEALEILYNDERLRRLYGEHGRDKVEKFYSWDKIIPQWDKLLKENLEK